MAVTVLVKLGGAAITNKAEFESLNVESLRASASSIKRAVESTGKGTETRFVVVHGAGSFGHHQAKKASLRGLFEPAGNGVPLSEEPLSEEQKTGFADTRLSVQKLNLEVVEALLRAGVRAVGCSPFSAGVSCGAGEGGCSNLIKLVEDCLQRGYVPVVHGDACFVQQDVDGGGIVGGDPITEVLAARFCSQGKGKCIFVTDVAGIYPSNPKVDFDRAKNPLIEEIVVNCQGQIINLDTTTIATDSSAGSVDVTGGMAAKIER
mgnify:CR=1 FL=1